MTGSKKTVEDTYKKVDQREHVLLRPGMYIGHTTKTLEEQWVFDEKQNKMIKKMIEYTPGFLKIFDEILTNATDHAVRDTSVTTIKVDISPETGEITVWNNGNGIPVVEHQEHKIYIPELIFGNLLTSSNYNDNEKRVVGGLNGAGSKLTNIYSKKFVIETVDSERQLKYKQEFSENMSQKGKPKITKYSGKSYTQITFLPDYPRFHMKGLEKDSILLLKKRVVDCIACSNKNVSVFLNGEKLKGKNLQDYSNYFVEDPANSFYDKHEIKVGSVTFVWEYLVIPYDKYEQVSFVNGINTTQGGKHVDYILQQVTTKLKGLLETKKKLKDIKVSSIKERMFLFLRATIVNPTFTSQTKEYLSTSPKDFGCKIEVSDKFVDRVYKSSITEEIVTLTKLKESLELSKQTDGKKKSVVRVPKLEDAAWAGTAKSNLCTLILTEGESAKTFAMWGRSVVGVEKYGVFPLKGKCISYDTKVPLWNGETKYAKDIQIGDVLIGDDGKQRNVLTLFNDHGKMYEVSQDRGDSYQVNDEHILTLCMPEHKVIFWVPSNYTWRTMYWDKETKTIKAKETNTFIKIECKECGVMINTKYLNRHYTRKHQNVRYAPYKLQDTDTGIDMNDPNVVGARKKLEDFLSNIEDNNIIDICIQDYLKLPESLKRKLKGIRGECVNWEHKDVLLDPYVLGLWLGDGGHGGYGFTCHSKKDPEIINYLNKWGEENDAKFKKIDSSKYGYSISSIDNFRNYGQAPLKKILSQYNLIKNKHIPKEYLINSEEIRLKLLAGIIDTDGYIAPDGTIEISQSHIHKQLADDIVYLARSLGFYTYISDKLTNYYYKNSGERALAYRIKISGNTECIPTILPRKKPRSTTQYNIQKSTGTIKIKSIEDQPYVGIGIDGNSRFLINDFTVTHNCLNVRDASVHQLINNAEIGSLKQIIGLKQGKEYSTTNDLRYGKLLLLTDSDVDGSHIKSLIMNMFHFWWPSLLKLGFLQTMKTPIVKAMKGAQVKEFFTQQDYEKWYDQTQSSGTWKIKYFKGLGTSKKEDAKDCFKRINDLQVDYYYKDANCDKAILLAFEKDKNVSSAKNANPEAVKYTDLRKNWLSKYNRNIYLDVNTKKVSIQDFIHKDLIHFSNYDNLRSIPSLCDGLKPSQRKILYYCLKKKLFTNEIKVAQLSGYISAETSYHHGETSLQMAIINMCQDFVGTNNINLLLPDSNMGSRYVGGKDAASPRYIYTKLNPVTGQLFHSDDTNLLNYLEEDGMSIEPEWFVPVLPMALINGCEGIGTGYSTYVPPYNPKDIIENIYRVLDDKEPIEMKPYWKGFRGLIESLGNGLFQTKGIYKRLSDTQVSITEIPVGTWVTPYKEFLESLTETDNKKEKPLLKDVSNKTTDENTGINFLVEFSSKSALDKLISSGLLEKELKLVKPFSTNNMYLFSDDLSLCKYKNATDILLDFYDIRFEFYEKRKKYLIAKLSKELEILLAKVKFITEYLNGTLDINKKSKDFIINLLESRNYPKFSKKELSEVTADSNNSDGVVTSKTFDYLIYMPIFNLSLEKINELEDITNKKDLELKKLKNTTIKQLWRSDLEKVYQLL